MYVEIIILMFAIGMLLGFVGAGGSGFIIAILTTVFGYSIHVVLGTALLAMLLSSISGAASHYREGNVQRGAGLVAGLAGGVGAWWGSLISVHIPEGNLSGLTATMLILSGMALWLRMRMAAIAKSGSIRAPFANGIGFWIASVGIGLVTGVMSGIFGIGSTPFIQIGLMVLLGLSMTQAAGTTMMIIVPIALGGGMGFLNQGLVDLPLLVQVAGSIMLGSYAGAKFTNRVPVRYLKAAMVIVPIAGGIILLA